MYRCASRSPSVSARTVLGQEGSNFFLHSSLQHQARSQPIQRGQVLAPSSPSPPVSSSVICSSSRARGAILVILSIGVVPLSVVFSTYRGRLRHLTFTAMPGRDPAGACDRDVLLHSVYPAPLSRKRTDLGWVADPEGSRRLQAGQVADYVTATPGIRSDRSITDRTSGDVGFVAVRLESDVVNEGNAGVKERRQHASLAVQRIDCRSSVGRSTWSAAYSLSFSSNAIPMMSGGSVAAPTKS